MRASWVRKQVRQHPEPLAVAKPGGALRVGNRPVLPLPLEPRILISWNRRLHDAPTDTASPYWHGPGVTHRLPERLIDGERLAFGMCCDKCRLTEVSS